MANDLTVLRDHDFTESEVTRIQEYKSNGLPGIIDVTTSQMSRMQDLYLRGSTYTQISNILNMKKILVLYLAHANDWYGMKMDHLTEIDEKMRNSVADTKLRNKEFMLLLVQAWQKKLGKKLTDFLRTGDDKHMENIDLKEVASLMKAIEMINDLDSEGKDSKGKTPAVGLNIGNGVTIEKTGDNQVSITPKDAPIGDLLRQYADSRREEEKKAIEVPVLPSPKE